MLERRSAQLATLAGLALIWGSSFILMKRGLETFDAAEVAAIRMSVATAVLAPVALANLREVRGRLLPLLVVGIVGSAIPAFLFATAQTRIASSLSGMLNSLTSLFTLVLGILFFRVRPGGAQWLGVGAALVGALGLIGFRHVLELSAAGRSALLVVAATAMYGVSVNVVKSRLADVRPHHITSLGFLFVGPALVVYVLGFTDVPRQLASEPGAWRALGYLAILGVVCTAFAVVVFNRLIKETTAVFAASVTYLIPVVAVGWGVADGEPVAARQLGFLALILGGIFLIHRPAIGSASDRRPLSREAGSG